MSRRIRVTAKRRREIDIDKLVLALLRVLEAEQVHALGLGRPAEGGTKPRHKESAA
jgi:hypothetical protein